VKLPWLLFILVSLPNLVLAQESLVFRAKKIQASPDLVYQPGEILVRESKIIRIGESIPKPKNHKFVDWSEFEIYPGLISPGSSLGLAEINAIRPTRDEREVGTHTPEIEAWTAVNPDSELIPVARANGITHSLIVPMGGTISGVSGLITLDGWGIEEMAIVQKVALHIWWPGQGLSIPNHNSEGKSIEEQKIERIKNIEDLDEFFNQAEAYKRRRLAAPKSKTDFNPSWEAMLPFVSRKSPLVIHADEKRQIASALDWAEKRKYKIIISGGRDSWKIAERIAAMEVPVIYRHVFSAPPQTNLAHDIHFRAPGILARAGVELSIGLRLGAWSAANQRNLPYHAAHAIPLGLKRKDALAAITIHPAKLMGVQSQLGTLEKGKDATFIACSGDLFDLRTTVEHMRIAGKGVDLSSRHTQLFEKYQRRPKRGN
jgi:imidazolonepropionase-like amidohydrolase